MGFWSALFGRNRVVEHAIAADRFSVEIPARWLDAGAPGAKVTPRATKAPAAAGKQVAEAAPVRVKASGTARR